MAITSRVIVRRLAGGAALAALMCWGGMSSGAWHPVAVPSAEPLAFSIPDEDGYGIADCMQAGNACGAAMATSWCEAHGHAKALAFGAADLTGSIAGATAAPDPAGGVMIRCGD